MSWADYWKEYRASILVLAVLQVADYLSTLLFLYLGTGREGNPLGRWLFSINWWAPIIPKLLVVPFAAIMLYNVYKYRRLNTNAWTYIPKLDQWALSNRKGIVRTTYDFVNLSYIFVVAYNVLGVAL